MSKQGPPEGYVDVADRIAAFYEKYPEGSLRREDVEIVEVGERTFVVYKALAYRHPEDKLPGQGTAWEPFPGPTPFTRDSELQNAETSAWGRAIAALGFKIRDGIATAQDVQNRSGNGRGEGSNIPSAKQVEFILGLAKGLGADEKDLMAIEGYCSTELTGGKKGSASRAIEALKGDTGDDPGAICARLVEKAHEWNSRRPEVEADYEGLPQ